MGGDITVTSEPGKGSTFTADLILDLPAPEASDALPMPSAGLPRTVSNIRALVVDKHATTRDILRSYLEDARIDCVCVANSTAAIAELNSTNNSSTAFDILIMDLGQPGTNGMSLNRQIRSGETNSDIPIILLSAYNDAPDETDLLQPIDGYLAKPVHRSELYARLATVLPQATPGTTLDEAPSTSPRDNMNLNARILLAEDNEVNQLVATEQLKMLGCSVDVAQNGREAVDAFIERNYDVILMDCQIPEMDGFQAVAAIRNHEKTGHSHIPVIALTAHASPEDRTRCIAAGMDEHLAKPFEREELFALLKGFLSEETVARHESVQEPIPSPATDDAVQIIDPSVADTLRHDNPNLWQRLISVYLSSAAEKNADMRRGFEDEDTDAIRMAAHTMKASSANMGAIRLSEKYREIETIAGATDLIALRILFSDTEAELESVVAALSAEQESNS